MKSGKNIHLLAEIPDKRFNAGEKARNDVVTILNKCDAKHIKFFKKGSNKIFVFKDIIYSMRKLDKKVQEDDYIVIQYPYSPIYAYKYIYNKLDKIKIKTKCNTIVIIHDLNYLRNNRVETNEFTNYTKKLEIDTLNNFDKIICHNEIMANKLIEDGIDKDKLVCLGIFDYIVNIEKDVSRNFDPNNIKISIAGNLNKKKSGYVYDLSRLNFNNISFELYGPGYDGINKNNIVDYKGVVSPEELPSVLNGNFGLVWDGTSLDECDGSLGEYLKYNNPHKASLYIACGLPLIVWSKSALSEFVLKNKIGIVVDSLSDLEGKIKRISKSDYEELILNLNNIRNNLVNGYYLKKAINKSLI